MKKILSALIFCLLLAQTTAAYEIGARDTVVIEKINTRLETIFTKHPKFTKLYTKKLFLKKAETLTNERTKAILQEVANSLEIPATSKVTLLEGWNIYDIDAYLHQRGHIEKGDYIAYTTDEEKIQALSEFFPFLGTQTTLEGYLYPDTYDIQTENTKINELVIKQLEAFETKVYEPLFKDKYTNSIIESVVNLASIVEKEEKIQTQKPVVAGILKKRVKEYWNLGADATLCYPYKLTSNECRSKLSTLVNSDTPYNTRKIIGLPPTPIANPSYETIDATLNHTDTPYYYYLHDIKTGKAYYAETLAEHNENKKVYISK